jgi:uncharacterized protein YdhG (YjbR/CyaY superfamily)
VDDYIAGFAPAARRALQRVRAAIRKGAPDAAETISYRIPAYRLDGMLVYFAGFKSHIGMYPVTRGVRTALGRELTAHLAPRSKASLRFPLDRPMPSAFITRVVRVRAGENRARAAAKR